MIRAWLRRRRIRREERYTRKMIERAEYLRQQPVIPHDYGETYNDIEGMG